MLCGVSVEYILNDGPCFKCPSMHKGEEQEVVRKSKRWERKEHGGGKEQGEKGREDGRRERRRGTR